MNHWATFPDKSNSERYKCEIAPTEIQSDNGEETGDVRSFFFHLRGCTVGRQRHLITFLHHQCKYPKCSLAWCQPYWPVRRAPAQFLWHWASVSPCMAIYTSACWMQLECLGWTRSLVSLSVPSLSRLTKCCVASPEMPHPDVTPMVTPLRYIPCMLRTLEFRSRPTVWLHTISVLKRLENWKSQFYQMSCR